MAFKIGRIFKEEYSSRNDVLSPKKLIKTLFYAKLIRLLMFISINKEEYYELNGDGIPYAKFGCRTLVEFLQSHPDKFQINR